MLSYYFRQSLPGCPGRPRNPKRQSLCLPQALSQKSVCRVFAQLTFFPFITDKRSYPKIPNTSTSPKTLILYPSFRLTCLNEYHVIIIWNGDGKGNPHNLQSFSGNSAFLPQYIQNILGYLKLFVFVSISAAPHAARGRGSALRRC